MQETTGVDTSLLLSKSTKGAARFNVPIQHTNRYQQHICLHNKYMYILEGFNPGFRFQEKNSNLERHSNLGPSDLELGLLPFELF